MTIEKVVKKGKISDLGNADLEYWLSRPAVERFSAVQTLRELVYGTGNPAGIQKVVRIIHQSHKKH